IETWIVSSLRSAPIDEDAITMPASTMRTTTTTRSSSSVWPEWWRAVMGSRSDGGRGHEVERRFRGRHVGEHDGLDLLAARLDVVRVGLAAAAGARARVRGVDLLLVAPHEHALDGALALDLDLVGAGEATHLDARGVVAREDRVGRAHGRVGQLGARKQP